MESLRALYGHVDGATALFEVLEKAQSGLREAEFFSSHPGTQKRIERIAAVAAALPAVTAHELQPLPTEFAAWLK